MHAAGIMLAASRSATRKRRLLREKDLTETLASMYGSGQGE